MAECHFGLWPIPPCGATRLTDSRLSFTEWGPHHSPSRRELRALAALSYRYFSSGLLTINDLPTSSNLA